MSLQTPCSLSKGCRERESRCSDGEVFPKFHQVKKSQHLQPPHQTRGAPKSVTVVLGLCQDSGMEMEAEVMRST